MQKTVGPLVSPLSRGRWLLALLVVLLGTACAAAGPGARGPLAQFAEYEGLEVARVAFVGETELPVDSLRDVVVTRSSRCWLVVLPVCLPFTSIGRDAYELDLEELSRDVLRLQLYYRDHGYYGTRVAPSVDLTGDEEVTVRFAIAPGDQVLLREMEIAGVEEILDSTEVQRIVPLEVGEPFRRIGFLATADTIRFALLNRGYAYADVLRNYQLDTIADVAQAQFIALPGPLVRVDTILFAGVNRLSERTLRRQITLREGSLLRLPELNQSQRNLYELPMVSFASLEIAPDSLQLDTDSARTTLLARVVEAPEYVVDAALGYGTVECIRTQASYLDRNFLGGGRSLEVTGLVSRIGVADPLDAGLDGSGLCAGSDDMVGFGRDFADYLNYRLAANFLQPRLLNTRTELAARLHWERLTELSAFLRNSVGGQVALSREIGRNKLLNASLAVERGFTLANPAAFCLGFDVCSLDDLARLEEARWSNTLSATGIWDRVRTQGVVSRGLLVRGTVDWSSALLASDDRYLRGLAEASGFRPLRPGWVLAGNIRAGSFLQGALGADADGYIPPERRFYAGGPNSVRGFAPNALGPTAYLVRLPDDPQDPEPDTVSSAIGGTQMVIASAELRAPAPLLPEFFRLAAFVDAGQVWARGGELDPAALRVTPGVGLRVLTPVGPVRLDVAYNGYPPQPGPLYLVDPLGENLLLITESFRPEGPSGLGRFRFTFAVGQAF